MNRSVDGLEWEWITEFRLPNNTWNASETTLRFMPDQELIALTRPHWIGTSKPPYKEWNWTKIGMDIGGPNFLCLPDGILWAAGRCYGEERTTVLARMTRDGYEPVLILPSDGQYGDALMWESYIFGGSKRRHDWNRIRQAADDWKSYIDNGKAILALSYVRDETQEKHRENVFYAYACAKLSGFLWAHDSILDKVRMGMPTGYIQVADDVLV